MKAERRHELQENDFVHLLQVGRTYLSDNARSIGMGVAVVVGLFVVVSLAVRSHNSNKEDKWRRLSQLQFDKEDTLRASLDAMAALAKESSDDAFVLTTLMDMGRHGLRWASKVDNPPDRDLNEKARWAFDELLRRYPDNPMALGVAHTGLATVEENHFFFSRDAGHKERAKQHLKAVIDDARLNGLPFQRIAIDRRDSLESTFALVRFVPGDAPEPPPAPERPALPDAESMKRLPPDLQVKLEEMRLQMEKDLNAQIVEQAEEENVDHPEEDEGEPVDRADDPKREEPGDSNAPPKTP
ncbi:MAG: hypothetical protein AABZ47_07345 [Planctomycetota bacterium]